MFYGCVQPNEQAVNNVLPTNGGQPVAPLAGDVNMTDKVLEEGIKLKKKNKLLRQTLVENEQKYAQEKMGLEKALKDLEMKMESSLLELNTKHCFDLKQNHDLYIYEISQLQQTIHQLRTELRINTQNVTSLQRINDELTQTLEMQQQSHEEFFKKFQDSLQSEYSVKLQNIISSHEHEKEKLQEELQRKCTEISVAETKAIMQEENAREWETKTEELHKKLSAIACLDCIKLKEHVETLDAEIAGLRRAQQDTRCIITGKDDELQYYGEENARLEKQVFLMQEDLLRRQVSPAIDHAVDERGEGGHIFVNMLKSEREQKLIQELQLAKYQICDLKEALDEVVGLKQLIEEEVHRVLEENAQLAMIVSTLQPKKPKEKKEGGEAHSQGAARLTISVNDVMGKDTPSVYAGDLASSFLVDSMTGVNQFQSRSSSRMVGGVVPPRPMTEGSTIFQE